MPTVYRAPDPLQGTFLIPGGNTVGNGVQLFTYVAGSSTKTTVYSDSGGTSAWANPIVLDSGGNLPSGGEIWIPTGITIDAVYAPSNDTDPPVSPYRTLQDVAGINDVNSAASEWVTGPTPTYVSGTQFTLTGDQTTNFKNGRRLRTTNTAGTIYSRITSVSFAAGTTTVNVVSDSGSLDSGLSAVFYSLLDPENTSITEYHVSKVGGTVASAGNGTTNIWGVPGTSIHVSGTNTINYFSSAAYAGAWRDVVFDGALTLTHNASTLALPTTNNIAVAAGDRARVVASTAANAVITQYERGNGRALAESMQFLASSAAASSATVDLVFSSAVASSFPAYLVTIVNAAPANDATALYIRMSEDGGATFNNSTTAYRYCVITFSDSDSAVTAVSTAAAAQIDVIGNNNMGNAAAESASGSVKLFGTNATAYNKRVIYDMSFKNSSGQGVRSAGQGEYASTAAITAVRFLMSGGNMNAGLFTLYGLRRF